MVNNMYLTLFLLDDSSSICWLSLCLLLMGRDPTVRETKELVGATLFSLFIDQPLRRQLLLSQRNRNRLFFNAFTVILFRLKYFTLAFRPSDCRSQSKTPRCPGDASLDYAVRKKSSNGPHVDPISLVFGPGDRHSRIAREANVRHNTYIYNQ